MCIDTVQTPCIGVDRKVEIDLLIFFCVEGKLAHILNFHTLLCIVNKNPQLQSLSSIILATHACLTLSRHL